MKKIVEVILVFLSLFFVYQTKAQEESPVQWSFEISEEPNVMGMYEITFTANIAEKWHMYSQHLPSPDDGPLPTVFSFNYQDAFDIVGNVAEQTKPHAVFDDVFEVNVNYFDGKAVFKQLVTLNDKDNGATVEGTVSYMVCNDNTCLPPVDVPFALTIKP